MELETAQKFVNKNKDCTDRLCGRWSEKQKQYFARCWAKIQAHKENYTFRFAVEERKTKKLPNVRQSLS